MGHAARLAARAEARRRIALRGSAAPREIPLLRLLPDSGEGGLAGDHAAAGIRHAEAFGAHGGLVLLQVRQRHARKRLPGRAVALLENAGEARLATRARKRQAQGPEALRRDR